MKLKRIEDIREILEYLKEKFEVILFGSSVEGGIRSESDIDIAVITRNSSKKQNMELQKTLLGRFPLKFDIRVFELFPIDIQISVIENYDVIFGNLLEISEYFYYFRKKWDDCKYRILSNQFTSFHERLSFIK